MDETPQPLLVSRVAESAYWAGRYLERVEGTARLIKAHSDLVIDLPRAANIGWRPLLAVMGISDETAPEPATEETVVGHLTADTGNPSSVRSSVAAIHRNLRLTRSVMPVDAAEVLIDLHNHVDTTASAAIERRTRSAWLSSVIRGCQTLSGVLTDTMSHDDAFCFFTVGRQLERADLTTRVLDVQTGVLSVGPEDALSPYLDLCWSATLRSVSALQSFRRRGVPSSAVSTLAFLLRDPRCPRSVEACLVEASRWLLEIPRHEGAMAACAQVGTLLQGVEADELVAGGLHGFVDELQLALSELHERVHATWFASEPATVVGSSR